MHAVTENLMRPFVPQDFIVVALAPTIGYT